ncbi:uncharacterized protein METZ01_LOCUS463893, partial [marine metagenome]
KSYWRLWMACLESKRLRQKFGEFSIFL